MAGEIYEVRDVYVSFGSDQKKPVEALQNISLEVTDGEFFTVIGPSGCGKTTLLKLMSGLIGPTAGELRFRGKQISGSPKGIGMAFQDPLLLPWRKVIDNLMLPIEILRLPKNQYRQKAKDLLDTVGLEGFSEHSAWELSGGMRQRVNLCRALINDPQVLLLDEPFGALDAFTREELWLVLQKLHRKEGGTAILVTHQLSEAVFLSDRVIVLSSRPGRIIHEEIISLSKPRALDVVYSSPFIEHVARLREKIER